ncbi:CBS domain-containing protein [Paraburkholderia sp. J41]|uniref:CBS domain-containing protein n=1 Tax=Paraburkholderia sp. J41 TaxID=2805433 RepID=UPI002AC326A2|nr:CBS domain-containing protein [Paraburkholderia sp. J41]
MNRAALDLELARVRASLDAKEPVPNVSVRELLRWAGAERRGANVVYGIRLSLREHGIDTLPNFNFPDLDRELRFVLAAEVLEPEAEAAGVNGERVAAGAVTLEVIAEARADDPNAAVGVAEAIAKQQFVVGGMAEPAFRVSRLLAASTPPRYVAPDCSVAEAMTIMMLRDYSQLPVMTTEREVKGIVTWSSIAHHLQFDGERPVTVQACMQQAVEVPESASLFNVIGLIAEESYVLVRGSDKKITGIVTATDLNEQFQQLSEPFLLLGEIENHIRSLIDGKFTPDELKVLKDPADANRTVESVADLTLGESIRLLESEDNWKKIDVPLDRAVFTGELNEVRRIRNDVMHFDPDGITPEDHDTLRAFVRFLHQIGRLH